MLTGGLLLLLIVNALTPRARQSWLSWMGLGVLAATAVALVTVSGPTPISVAKGLLSIDAFGTFFKVIFLLSAALTLLMSVRYLDIEGSRHGEYVFMVLCATLGMMFMASGTDLITIFIGLETMAIAFYILTGLLKTNRRSNEAAVNTSCSARSRSGCCSTASRCSTGCRAPRTCASWPWRWRATGATRGWCSR